MNSLKLAVYLGSKSTVMPDLIRHPGVLSVNVPSPFLDSGSRAGMTRIIDRFYNNYPKCPAGLLKCVYIFSTIVLLAFSVQINAKDEQKLVEVKPVYIDVHSGPGRGYPVFHAVERNEDVVVLKRRTGWVKVQTQDRYESVTGWVKQSELFDQESEWNNQKSRWLWSSAMGDLDGAQSIDMSLGYRLTNYLTAEANYGQATGDFSDIDYAYLRLNSAFRPIWKLTPYFAIGAGVLNTTPNTKLVQSEQRSDASMLAGFGVRSYLTRNFFMRLEYNQHLVLTDRDTNEEVDQWLFGLSVTF